MRLKCVIFDKFLFDEMIVFLFIFIKFSFWIYNIDIKMLCIAFNIFLIKMIISDIINGNYRVLYYI